MAFLERKQQTPSMPTPAKRFSGGLDARGIPKCVTPRWIGKRAEFLSGTLVIGLGLLANKWLGLSWNWYQWVLMAVAEFTSVAARGHFYEQRVRALRARLLQHDLSLCLRCGYVLRGLPDEHRCPECGQGYRLADTRQQWEHWLVTTKEPGISFYSRDSLQGALDAIARVRARVNCIRCGARLPDGDLRTCIECGAKNEIDLEKL